MEAVKDSREDPESIRSEFREHHSRSSGIFFKAKKVLFKKRSDYQEIEVIENEHFGKMLVLDGLVQTTEKDEFFYHEMLVHPALMTHHSPQRVLIIGGGDGGGLKEVLRYPLKEAYLVEIDTLVVEVSRKFFPWLSASFEDERAKLLIAEGKDFLRRSDESFDVVIVDSSDPVGPSRFLHEEGFFMEVKKHLNPGGIVATQVGSPFYHLDAISKKKAFLQNVFEVVRFYLAPVPTYPGGSWCFVFLSDRVDPLSVRRDPPAGLKYYSREIHGASFALPPYLRNVLEVE